uniref:Uncharacterized protein n=1 Tax=Caenorhabditis tropicalis TaxID=1561998 RepID=A0A1I7UP33_9PELO
MTTGYIMYPYFSNYHLIAHIYAWYLSIEASIIYYTEEFRLYYGWIDRDSAVFNTKFTVFIHRNVTPPSEKTETSSEASGTEEESSGKKTHHKRNKKSKKQR